MNQMPKCSNCRKAEALDTRWDRIKRKLCHALFAQQVIDISQEKYTSGFGDGYTKGFEHASTKFNPKMDKMWRLQDENSPLKTSSNSDHVDADSEVHVEYGINKTTTKK